MNQLHRLTQMVSGSGNKSNSVSTDNKTTTNELSGTETINTTTKKVTLPQAERVLTSVHEQLTKQNANDERKSSFLSISTAARYLRAYKDESKAAKWMMETYKYRQQVHADDIATNEDTYLTIWRELSKRSMFIATLNDGATPKSPVLILRKKAEMFDKADYEDYRRGLFFTLDCTARFADSGLEYEDAIDQQMGQWVVVMDLAGYSSKNSPPLSVSIETMKIYQNHFPERAKRIIMLDAPKTFEYLWMPLKRFIDPYTREKFIWISRSEGEQHIRSKVGDEVWKCIQMNLEDGKNQCADMIVAAGYLRPRE